MPQSRDGKQQFVVIFYTGYGVAPLREIMDCGNHDPRLDNRTFNKVMRKAKALNADSFVILIRVPRIWMVDYKGECHACGQEIES